MMISGRNNNNNKSGAAFPFTARQWQELEQQLLTFKYIMSGIPVPPELFSTVIRNPFTSSSSSGLFLPNQQQSLPFGWRCFQMGYGRKIDPEPGRCRRTDGKKWRCSKEACSDSKYCEKHMHRGKNKTKKQIQQVFTNTSPKLTTTNDPTFSPKINLKNYVPNSQTISPSNDDIIGTTTYPFVMGHNNIIQAHSYQPTTFYPFMSSQSSSSDNSTNFIHSTQNNFTAPHWLLDSESYDQPKKEMRYL